MPLVFINSTFEVRKGDKVQIREGFPDAGKKGTVVSKNGPMIKVDFDGTVETVMVNTLCREIVL